MMPVLLDNRRTRTSHTHTHTTNNNNSYSPIISFTLKQKSSERYTNIIQQYIRRVIHLD